MHGPTGDTIVHDLHCLADGAHHLSGVASIGDVSALKVFHGDFHVLDESKVNEALGGDGEERVAGDGEWPLVDLKDVVF